MTAGSADERLEMSVWLMDAVVALARALRGEGIACTVDQELALTKALAAVDLRDREQVRWAARACFLRGPHEGAAFERVFERFWNGERLTGLRGPIAEHGETDPRMPGPQHGGESLPQFRLEGRSGHLLDGAISRAGQEIPTAGAQEPGPGRRRGVLAAYSPEEVQTDRRRLEYERDELEAVRVLGDELRRAHPERLSRRLRPSRRRGRLDLRRTIRRALRTEGEALDPAWTSRIRHAATDRPALRRLRLDGAVLAGAPRFAPRHGRGRHPGGGFRVRHRVDEADDDAERS